MVGSVADVSADRAVLEAPGVRIVSLTVTEKGYGIHRAPGGCDLSDPVVAADLAAPQAARGVLGTLVGALRRRRAAGLAPFTLLSCDNLPGNGRLLRAGVLDFAARVDPALARWIAEAVAFPSALVDRITPAPDESLRAEAARRIGCIDLAAVATEPFCQWVIEDDFPQGRPDWDATLVSDVAPWERQKLRMLNGSHSMLAYAGFHCGKRHVRDVMADPVLRQLVARHLRAAGATLPGETPPYAAALMRRFADPFLAHETFQIAMDGSVKMPQRILDPAQEADDLRPFAFATAAWMRHTSGRTHDTPPYAWRDPLAGRLTGLQGLGAEALYDTLSTHVAIPPRLRDETLPLLAAMLTRPMAEVVAEELALRPPPGRR